jgi:predicted glycosyltransferase
MRDARTNTQGDKSRGAVRILIYSHDSFGLGHLRRCRAIAHALAESNTNYSVLILTGSSIIGSFDFRPRVDFVRVPGVIKLRNGEYTPHSLHIDIEQTLRMRASIVQHTADIFDPDLFLVDKEPLGLRGEVHDTLAMLKMRGTPVVLGLRDVMDEPSLLAPEWRRKRVVPALRDLYDEIWIYGLAQFCDPLAGIDLPRAVRNKIAYTGYLHRSLTNGHGPQLPLQKLKEPFLLVTTGGGGDGDVMIDWVLRAYEEHPRKIPQGALLVLGPFMQTARQAEFLARAAKLPQVEAITFDAHIEHVMAQASGVVAMGGYNTFCEILSFDKKALIVPRTVPRMEQYIRAARAEELGLVRMLPEEGRKDAAKMARALRDLPDQPLPSQGMMHGMLDGLTQVDRLVGSWVARHREPALALAQKSR